MWQRPPDLLFASGAVNRAELNDGQLLSRSVWFRCRRHSARAAIDKMAEDLLCRPARQGIPEGCQGLAQYEGAICMRPALVPERIRDFVRGCNIFWPQAHCDDSIPTAPGGSHDVESITQMSGHRIFWATQDCVDDSQLFRAAPVTPNSTPLLTPIASDPLARIVNVLPESNALRRARATRAGTAFPISPLARRSAATDPSTLWRRGACLQAVANGRESPCDLHPSSAPRSSAPFQRRHASR
jgi:hypothetical protein